MPLPFIAQLLISLVIQAVATILTPRPRTSGQAQEFADLEEPKAEAGMTIPVIFGEAELRTLNVLWSGDKQTIIYEVS